MDSQYASATAVINFQGEHNSPVSTEHIISQAQSMTFLAKSDIGECSIEFCLNKYTTPILNFVNLPFCKELG